MANFSNSIININGISIVSSYYKLFVKHNLISIDSLFQQDVGKSLQKPGLDNWRERVRFSLLDDEGYERVFYLKRFTNPPSKQKRDVGHIKNARSIAGVEWLWMWQFIEANIPCPQPVVFGEEFENGHEIRSVVVTEEVPGKSLEQWVNIWILDTYHLNIKPLLLGVASIVKRMHNKDFIHRDLYLCHLFYDPKRVKGESIHIIDLQRVFKMKFRKTHWIIKELASLNYSTPINIVSTTNRVRWYLNYVGKSCLENEDKRFIRKIVKKTNRIRKHDERRKVRFDKMSF